MTFSLFGSLVDAITTVLAVVGLPGLLALMAVESFGIPPIPSEVILPFAGFLVAEGVLPLGGTILVAVVGGLAGAYAAYAVGRWWRSRFAGLGLGYLRIRERDLDRMDAWFARRGEATVALSRLIPGVRSYISYPAGTARMHPLRFGAYTLAGSLPWTLAMLYAGIVLRADWIAISHYFEPIDISIIAGAVAAGVYLALVVVGEVAPGWPPRWGPRHGLRAGASVPTPPTSPRPPG